MAGLHKSPFTRANVEGIKAMVKSIADENPILRVACSKVIEALEEFWPAGDESPSRDRVSSVLRCLDRVWDIAIYEVDDGDNDRSVAAIFAGLKARFRSARFE